MKHVYLFFPEWRAITCSDNKLSISWLRKTVLVRHISGSYRWIQSSYPPRWKIQFRLWINIYKKCKHYWKLNEASKPKEQVPNIFLITLSLHETTRTVVESENKRAVRQKVKISELYDRKRKQASCTTENRFSRSVPAALLTNQLMTMSRAHKTRSSIPS